MIYAAIVAEEDVDSVRKFESQKELDIFEDGMNTGASLYGGGSWGVYTEDEESLEELEGGLRVVVRCAIAEERAKDERAADDR